MPLQQASYCLGVNAILVILVEDVCFFLLLQNLIVSNVSSFTIIRYFCTHERKDVKQKDRR